MNLSPNLIFLGLPLALLACAPESQTLPDDLGVDSSDAEKVVLTGGDFCNDLLAGQTTDAGDVCLTVVGSDIVVTFTTHSPWTIDEAHLWLGDNLADMPQTRQGSPKIGNFPYNSGDISPATTVSFKVPLSDFGLEGDETSCIPRTFFVAAHAALRKPNGDGTFQTETGWGDGDRFVSKGTWATFFGGELSCDDDGGGTGPRKCETAFAYDSGGTCFLDIDENGDKVGDFNRWGWSIGPLAKGSYTYKIYAGAGKCDITKGVNVGSLKVEYDGSTAKVTYNIDPDAAWSWEEHHVYVGSEILPRNNGDYTVAPGQYPVVADADVDPDTEVYTVTGLSGSIYVVAHAATCPD